MNRDDDRQHLCGLYVRVSTDRQAAVEDGSLDAQTARLQDYVSFESRSGVGKWSVVEIYREEGKSGKDLKRPEFERMMHDTETGRINTIVFCKLDRFTRSLSDFLNLWPVLQGRGIQLISLHEKWDTGTAIGRAMLRMSLIWAELERDRTSERTAATLAYRASQGQWNGGRILGYDPDPDAKGGLRINEEYATVVRLAYDQCLALKSAGATMRWLNDKGYRIPSYVSRRGKKQGGGMFTKQYIVRVLTNPTYVGDIQWKGKTYRGQHEPLIDRKKFDRVQAILGVNRKGGNRRSAKQHVFLLQGLVRCGKCGTIMTPTWSSGRSRPYHYYGCSKRQHIGKQACDSGWVPAEALEELIVGRLKELSTDRKEIDLIVDQANGRQSEMLKKLASDQRRLKRQIQDVQEKLESLVQAIESGGKKAFRSVSDRMAELEAERSDLEEQVKLVKFEACRIKEETLSASVMAETFATFGQVVDTATPQEIQTLIPQIVEVIEWHEDPEHPGSGHYRMSYFEQPRLALGTAVPASESGNIGTVGRSNWLPGRNPASTNSLKSAWEVTPYYTRAYEKGCLLVRGDKPRELAEIAKITARQWNRYQNGRQRENPILKGLQYLNVFEDESVRTYAQAAEVLGVSRERVYQLTSLVTKLPPKIKDFLAGTDDPALLRFFTERRLRPLTMLTDQKAQMAKFGRLLAEATGFETRVFMGYDASRSYEPTDWQYAFLRRA